MTTRSRMRRSLYAVALLCAVALAALWVREQRGAEGPSGASPRVPEDGVVLRGALEEAAATTRATTLSPLVNGFGGPVVLDGEPTEDSGFVLAAMRTPGAVSTPLRLPIVDGRWSYDGDAAEGLEIYRGELDGVAVWPSSRRLELLLEEEVPLHLTAAPRIWIVDRATDQELPVVALACLWQLAVQRHAGAADHIGRVGTIDLPTVAAPIDASTLGTPCSYLFTSEGYTWGSLEMWTPRAAVVQLDAAGSLDVVIRSGLESLDTESVLRLRRVGGDSRRADYIFRIEQVSPELQVRKLAAGEYQLEIASSPDEGPERILARGLVDIVAHEHARIAVDLAEPSRSTVQVQILLYGDAATVARVSQLAVASTGRLAMAPTTNLVAESDVLRAEPGLREWRVVELPADEYAIEIHPFGRIELMKVPDDVLHVHDIELPAARSYTLHVFDSKTGQHSDVVWYNVWSASPSDEGILRKWPPRGGRGRTNANPLVFDAIPGSMKVALRAGHGVQYVAFDGENVLEHTVHIGGFFRAEIALTSRGESLDFPTEWFTGIRLTTPSGAPVHFFMEFVPAPLPGTSAGFVLLLSEPGAYVLTLPAPPGELEEIQLDLEVAEESSSRELDLLARAWME